jgi:MFS family permease
LRSSRSARSCSSSPPDTGDAGAIELIVFRLVQAVGASFTFANSAAILTDAFPADERGKALGFNMIAFLSGQFIGLILGSVAEMVIRTADCPVMVVRSK